MYRKNQDVVNEGEDWTDLFKHIVDTKKAGRPAAVGVPKMNKISSGINEDKLSNE